MALTDIFGGNLFEPIDFTKKFEGIVVGTDHFLTDHYIDVFLYELFVTELPMLSRTNTVIYNKSTKNLLTNFSSDSSSTGVKKQLQDKIIEIRDKISAKKYTPDTTRYIETQMKSAISILQKNPKLDNNNKIFYDALTLLKEAEDGLQEQENVTTINKHRIERGSSLVFDTTVKSLNYIKCYPKLNYGFDLDSYTRLDDDLRRYYVPNIGDKVSVEFLNGDPKLPYYKFDRYYEIKSIKLDDSIGDTGDKISDNKNVIDDPDKNSSYNRPSGSTYMLQNYYRLLKPTRPVMVGGDIARLRKKLKTLGCVFSSASKSDTAYDSEMEAFVIKYQMDYHITEERTGTVGPITYTSIAKRADYTIGQKYAKKDLEENKASRSYIVEYRDKKLPKYTYDMIKNEDITEFESFNKGYDAYMKTHK